MMRSIALTALLGGTVLLPSLHAQGEADQLTYYDVATKKDVKIQTKTEIVEETPTKIVIKQGNQNKDILIAHLRDIEYFVGAGTKATYRKAGYQEAIMLNPTDKEINPSNKDPKKAFEDSLDAYKTVLMDIKGKKLVLAERHMQFCMGRLLARRSEADPTQAELASQILSAFIKDNPDSWQLCEAGKLLGQIQEMAGRKAEAVKVYEELSARIDIPKELRLEFDFLLARVLIKSDKPTQAQERLTKIAAALPKEDPLQPKVQVYQAECLVAAKNFSDAEKALKVILNGSGDYTIKGMAANSLGDCYRLQGKAEDAMWQYLWVDQLYNADKHEHSRALYWLSKVFPQVTTVKDAASKALACKQKLQTKDFNGLEYQKLVAREEAGGMK
jgi:tetratricopeptide (TPR) repeat protein